MDLKTYCKERTQTALAKSLSVSKGLVSQWVGGKTSITATRAKQIEEATGGLVTRHELRPDIFDKSA